MKIHILQHVAFETPGLIEEWIEEHQHQVSFTHVYQNTPLPDLNSFELLIIMGGPMGVYDTELYSWLDTEKTFIAQAIANKKAVLGVCLGSQLIAAALSEKVFPNEQKEIGWFPIMFTTEAHKLQAFEQFPTELTVFHWHGDTFTLPNSAALIASSKACKNQAFIIEDRVIGLQFHLEMTPSLLQKMLENCESELVDGLEFIQSKEYIIAQQDQNQLKEWLYKILDYLATQNS